MRRDHDRLLAQMEAFEAAKLEEWCASIGEVSEQTLKQPLLRCARRTPTTSIGQVAFACQQLEMLSCYVKVNAAGASLKGAQGHDGSSGHNP